MTSQQEQFAREVAAGKSQAEAYRSAFPKSRNWKEGTARKRASELMRRGDISGTVEELRREADAEAVMELRELRTRLTARIRAVDKAGGKDVDFCRLADSLARVSGWLSPAALAIAISPASMSPEERERRIDDILGIPHRTHEAEMTPEERRRRINEALGIPEPTPEERARRWREMLGWPVEDATPAPQPSPVAIPAPCEAETIEPRDADTEDGEGEAVEVEVREPEPEAVPVAVEPEPAPVEETPERRERIARILAYVQRRGASTRDEARALALTFEGGSVIGSEATAVADAWEAEQQTGGDND